MFLQTIQITHNDCLVQTASSLVEPPVSIDLCPIMGNTKKTRNSWWKINREILWGSQLVKIFDRHWQTKKSFRDLPFFLVNPAAAAAGAVFWPLKPSRCLGAEGPRFSASKNRWKSESWQPKDSEFLKASKKRSWPSWSKKHLISYRKPLNFNYL